MADRHGGLGTSLQPENASHYSASLRRTNLKRNDRCVHQVVQPGGEELVHCHWEDQLSVETLKKICIFVKCFAFYMMMMIERANPAICSSGWSCKKISPPIDRPKCPEDDPNEHPDWKSSRGKDNVSCFGKTGLLAGEVGNEGNKEETTLK